MAELAFRSEKVTDGMIGILPAPLRETARSVRNDLAARASRILGVTMSDDAVRSAADFLVRADSSRSDVAAFMHVLACGWEYLRARRSGSGEMFSETITATQVTFDGGRGGGAAKAAHLLEMLRLSTAIGLPPGLPSRRTSARQADVDIDLCALFVWLLAQRPKDPSGEESLIGLAAVLTAAHAAEVVAAAGNASAMAGLLADLSAQL